MGVDEVHRSRYRLPPKSASHKGFNVRKLDLNLISEKVRVLYSIYTIPLRAGEGGRFPQY